MRERADTAPLSAWAASGDRLPASAAGHRRRRARRAAAGASARNTAMRLVEQRRSSPKAGEQRRHVDGAAGRAPAPGPPARRRASTPRHRAGRRGRRSPRAGPPAAPAWRRTRSCPAARQRSRSPAIAWAVTATIGVATFGPPLLRANRRGGLVAVHPRHLHVHQDDVEAPPAASVTASLPVGRHRHLVAALLEHVRDQRRLVALSSTTSTSRRRAGRAGAAAAAAATRRRRSRRGDRGEQRRAAPNGAAAWSAGRR